MIISVNSLCQLKKCPPLNERKKCYVSEQATPTVRYVYGHRSTKHYCRNLKRLYIINKSFNGHKLMKGHIR